MINNNKQAWSKYFQAWKKIYFDPSVPWHAKLLLKAVELHRSDEKGWFLSERFLANELGTHRDTVSKAINFCLNKGWLEDRTEKGKTRKLRLSGRLRSPVSHEKSSAKDKNEKLRLSGLPDQPVEAISENKGKTHKLAGLNSQGGRLEQPDTINRQGNGQDTSSVKTSEGKKSPFKRKGKRKTTSYPKDWYSTIISEYCSLKGISLQGSEYQPLQQTCKSMFMDNRSVAEVLAVMRWLANQDYDWTLRTVKMKLPEVLPKLGMAQFATPQSSQNQALAKIGGEEP